MTNEQIEELIFKNEEVKFNWLSKKFDLEKRLPSTASPNSIHEINVELELVKAKIQECDISTTHLKSLLTIEQINVENNKIESSNKFNQLIQICSEIDKGLSNKDSKKDFEEYEAFTRELSQKLFDDFETQVDLFPSLQNHYKDTLFEQIYTTDKLDAFLLSKIRNVRENKSTFQWYDRSLVVSGLIMSLLGRKVFDVNKANLLIDFITDFEENVWQKALVGLTINLIVHVNKWQKIKSLKDRISTLQNIEKVQEGLDIIEFILRNDLYKSAVVPIDMYATSFFIENIKNCFQPFYEENPILDNLIESAPFHADTDKFKNSILNIPFLSSVKYYICNKWDFGEEKTNQLSAYDEVIFRGKLTMADSLSPYYNFISEIYFFTKLYPQSAIKNIFTHQLNLGSNSKLRTILLKDELQQKVIGETHRSKGEVQAAINVFEKILITNPNDFNVLWSTASCYEDLKKFEDANIYRGRIKKLFPEEKDNLMQMGLNFQYLKLFKKAKEIHLDLFDKDPTWIRNIIELADSFYGLNEFPKSLDTLKKIDDVQVVLPTDLFSLGIAYSNLSLYEKGIKYKLEAISHDPNEFQYISSVISDCLYTDRQEDAKKYLEKAKELATTKEDDLSISFSQGLIDLMINKNLDAAKNHFIKAANAEPPNEAACCNMANALYFQGNKKDAIEYYKKSISKFGSIELFLLKFQPDLIIFNVYGLADQFDDLIVQIKNAFK